MALTVFKWKNCTLGTTLGQYNGTFGEGGEIWSFPRAPRLWKMEPATPKTPPKYSPQNSGKQIFEKITLKPSQLASKWSGETLDKPWMNPRWTLDDPWMTPKWTPNGARMMSWSSYHHDDIMIIISSWWCHDDHMIMMISSWVPMDLGWTWNGPGIEVVYLPL